MNRKKTDLIDIRIGEEISSIDTVIEGYKSYQVLRAALALDLFDWLDEHGPTLREEIGKALSINGMFTRSFFQTLIDLGYLSVNDDRFGITDLASRLLVRSSPAYQGDWILNAADTAGQWSNLAGTLALTAPKNTGFSEGPSPQFLKAAGERALRGEVQGITKILIAWEGFRNAEKLLDIGGGHGLYAIAACQQNPRLHAVVFDKPHVVDLTRDYIQSYGMEDRITVMAGDIVTEDSGSGYDVVLISHLLYKFRADLPAIFKKVGTSLKPRGLFVSNHWFCGPVCGAGSSGVRELDRSLHSYGHPLCHPDDFAAAMFMNGLVVTKRATIASNFGESQVHVAEKVPEGESPLPREARPCGCSSCQ